MERKRRVTAWGRNGVTSQAHLTEREEEGRERTDGDGAAMVMLLSTGPTRQREKRGKEETALAVRWPEQGRESSSSPELGLPAASSLGRDREWVDGAWASKPQPVVRSPATVDARHEGGGSPGLSRRRGAV